MRSVLRTLLGLLVVGFCAPAWAESRLAFVVGINAYANLPPEAQLQRAVTDANAVGDALAGLGFTVTRVTQDGSIRKILDDFDRFTRSIQPGDTVLFYYAGHGISLDDGNYLIPADVPALGPHDERIAKRYALSEREVKQDLRAAGARVAIVVLDACRNNPFPAKGTRAIGTATRGLARVDATDGVYSLYSAREGQSALDRLSDADQDPDSVFTRVFLKELRTPGVSLSELGDIVRDDVATLARTASAEQVPAVSNDLIGARSVYLAGRMPSVSPEPAGRLLAVEPAPKPLVPPATPPVQPPDEIAWTFVGTTSDPRQIESFLTHFPESTHRPEAEARLAELKRNQVAALTPSSPRDDQSTGRATPDPVLAQCDDLAAMAFDRTRPPGVAGRETPRAVDGLAAVPVCRRALAANPGDPRLKMQLGIALIASFKPSGAGMSAMPDPSKSPEVTEGMDLLRQSADGGNAAGMMLLGVTLIEMRDDAGSHAEGVDWLGKAAGGGVTVANAYLGGIFERGKGVRQDKTEALAWYRKGEAAGDAQAKADAERLTKLMLGDASDPSVAECDRLAALQLDPNRPAGVPGIGLDALGQMDTGKAIPACRAAVAARPQDPRLKIQLAMTLIDQYEKSQDKAKDGTELLALLQQAAGADYPAGLALLGALYTDEHDAYLKDKRAEGLALLNKAAGRDVGFAMDILGDVYERGRDGVAADKAEALAWYRKAVAAGYASAAPDVERLAKEVPSDAERSTAAALPVPSVAECDRLAAWSGDPTRPAGVPGVDPDAVDPAKAVPACRAAVAALPQEARLKFQLAMALMKQSGGEHNPDDQTVATMRAAAAGGNPAAMLALSFFETNQQGKLYDIADAMRLLRKAAEGGVVMAQLRLGEALELGDNMTKDKAEAKLWYDKAAAGGNDEAVAALKRLGGTAGGTGTATDCDRLAAMAMDPNKPAGIDGFAEPSEIDADKAVPACRAALAADPNNARFKVALGLALHKQGGDKKDLSPEFVRLMTAAAEAGDLVGMWALGYFTIDSSNDSAIEEAGFAWLRKAAEGNIARAQYDLAMNIKYGIGVAKDIEEAKRWFHKSEDGGYSLSKYALESIAEDEQKASARQVGSGSPEVDRSLTDVAGHSANVPALSAPPPPQSSHLGQQRQDGAAPARRRRHGDPQQGKRR